MSPQTVKVRCPHYGGQREFESEGVEEVASSQDGVEGASIVKRGSCSDGDQLFAILNDWGGGDVVELSSYLEKARIIR